MGPSWALMAASTASWNERVWAIWRASPSRRSGASSSLTRSATTAAMAARTSSVIWNGRSMGCSTTTRSVTSGWRSTTTRSTMRWAATFSSTMRSSSRASCSRAARTLCWMSAAALASTRWVTSPATRPESPSTSAATRWRTTLSSRSTIRKKIMAAS